MLGISSLQTGEIFVVDSNSSFFVSLGLGPDDDSLAYVFQEIMNKVRKLCKSQKESSDKRSFRFLPLMKKNHINSLTSHRDNRGYFFCMCFNRARYLSRDITSLFSTRLRSHISNRKLWSRTKLTMAYHPRKSIIGLEGTSVGHSELQQNGLSLFLLKTSLREEV